MRGLKILIVPDKFKGTLNAPESAAAIGRGWRFARPRDFIELLPMTDGGDGFGDVMKEFLHAETRLVRTVDAAHRSCKALWALDPKTQTAVIESASVIGLAMLPAGKFHPFELDTFGLGVLLKKIAVAGARRCLIGLGGTATNDGGFGLARALGWEFRDKNGKKIIDWAMLEELETICRPPSRRLFTEVIAAVDVRNPLLGARGAARVYGPQKGLHGEDLNRAERCLRRLARVLARELERDFSEEPGAGAAGGLGFGLRSFLQAHLEPGFELFARESGIEKDIKASDLVITGEGTIDPSTFMGKGVGQVARKCRLLGIQCLGFAGQTKNGRRSRWPFTRVHALTELTDLVHAKRRPAYWLEQLAARVASSWLTRT